MDKEHTNVIIIHGTKGSPEINWFRWVESQLHSQKYNVYIPQLPTPESQSPDSWSEALNNQVPEIGKNTILIGHSIGATFMLHILEKLKSPIAQSIFVSVVMDEINIEEYDSLNKSFLNINNFDWLTISNNAGNVNILHGGNDPYVSQEHSEFLQDQIGGELLIIPHGGHLNTESGYTQFPLIVDIINSATSAEPPCALREETFYNLQEEKNAKTH